MDAGRWFAGALAGAAVAALGIAAPADAKIDFSPGKVTPGGPLLVEGGELELRLEPAGKGKAVRVFGEPSPKGAPVIVSPKAKPGKYALVGCEGRKCERAKGSVKVVKPKPRPLEVTPQPEPGGARSARIGPEGGTITATAADGSVLTLTLPPDALTAPGTITLTPLGGIDGQPLDFVAGAELGPSGLRLLKEATLTIDPAAQVKDPIGFGYSDAANEAAMTPAFERSGALSIPLTHFSGGAMLDARPAQWIKLGTYVPSSSHLEAQKRLAESLQLRDDASDAALESALSVWYGARVKPRMKLAQSSDEILEDAIAEAQAWNRFVEVLARGKKFRKQLDELDGLMKTAIENALARSVAACQDHRDVFFHARRLLFLPRAAQVLGAEVAADPSEYGRCLRFELDVEGQLTLAGVPIFGDSGEKRIDTRTTYAVRDLAITVSETGPNTGIPIGTKPAPDLFTEEIMATHGDDCRFVNQRITSASTFRPQPQTEGRSGGYDLDPNLGMGNHLLEDRIELGGNFSGVFHDLQCKSGGPDYLGFGPRGSPFNTAYQGLYSAAGDFDVNGFPVVRDWRVFDGSSLHATKEVSRTVVLTLRGQSWAAATESTTWALHHTPG